MCLYSPTSNLLHSHIFLSAGVFGMIYKCRDMYEMRYSTKVVDKDKSTFLFCLYCSICFGPNRISMRNIKECICYIFNKYTYMYILLWKKLPACGPPLIAPNSKRSYPNSL